MRQFLRQTRGSSSSISDQAGSWYEESHNLSDNKSYHESKSIACTAVRFAGCHMGHTSEKMEKREQRMLSIPLQTRGPQRRPDAQTKRNIPDAQPANPLVHLPDELVDVGFPVAEVTTLDEMLELACPPATGGVGELERPKEVRCLENHI